MKINHIRKVKGLYEIVFDHGAVMYHEEVIIKYRLLNENIEVSEDVYKLTLLDNRYFFNRDKALKYLNGFKFISQVRDYLLKYEEKNIVDRVIDFLVEYKIINDYITSTNYLISRYKRGYGNKELKRKLNEFKVCKDIIDTVINENIEFELECLDSYTDKLFKTIKSLNNKDLKKKIEHRLISHGFNSIDIKNILNKNNDRFNEVEFSSDIFCKQFDKAIRKYCDISDNYIKEQKIINFLTYRGFDYYLIKDKMELWKKGE